MQQVRVLSLPVYRYEPRPNRNAVLLKRLRKLAQDWRRFGSPRLHMMLNREGRVVNHNGRSHCIGRKAWRCAGSDAAEASQAGG